MDAQFAELFMHATLIVLVLHLPPMSPIALAHWAESDYGLSAGQHAVLPEGKVTDS